MFEPPLPAGTHFRVVQDPPHTLPSSAYAFVGDFDGNGGDDIFWYGKGATKDYIWLSMARHTFEVHGASVNGNYEPFTGDFDGDGKTEMFRYAPGTGADSIWYDVMHGTGRPETVNGNYQPIVDDFNGDGVDDIIWWAPGPTPDFIWYGQRNRTFVQEPLTINGNVAISISTSATSTATVDPTFSGGTQVSSAIPSG